MSAFIDLTNRKFELLTCLYRSGTHRSGAAIWACKCDCGSDKIKHTTIDNLRDGSTSSCGCMRGAKAKDLTGLVFGNLTVISREGSKDGDANWLCRCDCNTDNTVFRTSERLHANKNNSCGCVNYRIRTSDLTGQVFGKLTVLRKLPGGKWECQCSCKDKTITHVANKKLVSGERTGCSCILFGADRSTDLTGQRFGKLIALYKGEKSATYKRSTMWVTQCDCDPEGKNLKTFPAWLLVSGKTGSCGCASQNGEIVRTEEARQKARDLRSRKYGTDLKFTLNTRTRALMKQSLKYKGARKLDRTFASLGYTIQMLEDQLAKTMPEGYTWKDFLEGRLEIDHKVPLATFNFETDQDTGFKEAWALTNLQLLTRKNNRAKRDRLDWSIIE